MSLVGSIVAGPTPGYGMEPFPFEGRTVSVWTYDVDGVEIAAVMGHQVATGYMVDRVISTWDNAAQFGNSARGYCTSIGQPYGIGTYWKHIVEDVAKPLLPQVYPRNLGVPVVQNDADTSGPDGLTIINRMTYQWSEFGTLANGDLDVRIRSAPKT